MTMTGEILVPLDGSHFAEQALPCALKLGQAMPGRLTLLGAVSSSRKGRPGLDEERSEGEGDSVLREQVATVRDYLEGIAQSIGGAVADVGCAVQEGPAAKAIVDYAAEMGMGQIVMATHGRNGHRGWANGSVAERVVQTAGVPVLLVHGREQDAEVDLEPASCCRVLVALDGSDWAEQILPQVAATVGPMGCELVLFHASCPFLFECSSRAADRMAEAYLQGVARRLEAQGLRVSTAVRSGPVAETIVEYAQANDIDMVALPTHGRRGIAGKILGSVAAQVLHWGTKPVWLVRVGRVHRTPRVPVGLRGVPGLGPA
jgi:nucleotide-binding universal stress UspA family protein